MADTSYNRWQGLAIAQLSVAVALISGLSVSALAVGLSLLQNEKFIPYGAFKLMFTWSFPLLLLAVIFSSGTVISRMLDFRLTARKVRKTQKPIYTRPLKIFWLSGEIYEHITWFLFWVSCLAFLAGIVFLFSSVWGVYAHRF